ncbi:AAA-domain-containing protein, partial [Lentithecium fluviatile CBS 122367]
NLGKFHVRFKDVITRPEIILGLKHLIELSMRRPEEYTHGVLKGNRIPGALLYGPPGTGKTMLARAIATEADCPTIEVSGAQVLQRYLGESEKIIQNIFSLAKEMEQCVVFLDEADSVFTSRSNSKNSWERSMVNQFLHEWDSLASGSERAFIVVATNRPQDIDDAILRRLPRRFHLALPSKDEREAILKHYLADERCPSVDFRYLAVRTHRYSGSDLKNLCVQAASTAVAEAMQKPSTTAPGATKPQRILTMDHFHIALQDIRPAVTDETLHDIAAFEAKYGRDLLADLGLVEKFYYRLRSRTSRLLRK